MDSTAQPCKSWSSGVQGETCVRIIFHSLSVLCRKWARDMTCLSFIIAGQEKKTNIPQRTIASEKWQKEWARVWQHVPLAAWVSFILSLLFLSASKTTLLKALTFGVTYIFYVWLRWFVHICSIESRVQNIIIRLLIWCINIYLFIFYICKNVFCQL